MVLVILKIKLYKLNYSIVNTKKWHVRKAPCMQGPARYCNHMHEEDHMNDTILHLRRQCHEELNPL